MRQTIHVVGGGTLFHVRHGLALCAPSDGKTAKALREIIEAKLPQFDLRIHFTKMADSLSNVETSEDVANLVDRIIDDKTTKIVFFNPALVDFEGFIESDDGRDTQSGKYQDRLRSRTPAGVPASYKMHLVPTPKLMGRIRDARPDTIRVGFRTTSGLLDEELRREGNILLANAGAHLVLAKDTRSRANLVLEPNNSISFASVDRDAALNVLVDSVARIIR